MQAQTRVSLHHFGMNPAATMSEGMDPDNIQPGMLIVGHRDSSLATSGSDDWVRTPNNIPTLMNAPYETSSSTNLVSRKTVFGDLYLQNA